MMSSVCRALAKRCGVDKKVVRERLRFIVVEALSKVSLREDIPAALVEELVTWGLTVYPEAGKEVPIHAKP